MFLLFDIGGTKIRLAVSRNGNSFAKPKIVETPKDFDEGMSLFEKTAAELSGGEKIRAASGGIAGLLDQKKEKLVNSPNLPGWVNKPLKETIAKLIDVPVYIENDAAVVGLGEAVVGAGKGYEIVAYITVSTGVGGARIVDGKIDRNRFGFEPGHQIINPAGTLFPSRSISRHLEGLVSGTALEKRYHKKPYEISDPKIWEEEAHWLAYGLNNTIVHWSPHVVVLGGSLMHKISIEKVASHLEDILTIFPTPTPIVRAKLGDIGGLYGSIALLKQVDQR